MRAAIVAVPCLFVLAASSKAQSSLFGYHQYPQFRVLSGLPGGGFGVLPNGRPSIQGATALTTPIAYSLGGHGALGIFNTGVDLDPFQLDVDSKKGRANGTLEAMVGGEVAGFRGTASVMVLSTVGDTAFNFQVSPPIKGRIGVGLGVQDVAGGGGASGTGYTGDDDTSRSFYGVATYDLGHAAYVSAGAGDRRFQGGFANASALVLPRLRAMVEYDSFNWNGGFVYNTGRWGALGDRSRAIEGNVFLGLVRGQYGTVGLTLTF